jgi:transposase-like protein
MARNKVQFQKGMSEAQFDGLYGTEPPCHAALARWRWPEGFECPGCEGRDHCIVKRGARTLYQCNACRKQTSVTAGTIFASSKLPLRLWFKAMYLMTQSKKGISSIELGRRLGVTQTTAWTLKHKLAQVMIERNAAKCLTGEVQMDDAYIGGHHPGTYGRGAGGKTPFVAAVAVTAAGKPDQIILRRVAGFTKIAIAKLAGTALAEGVHAVSDALRCFNAVTGAGGTHTPVKTGSGAKAAKNPHFKWVNTVLGNIKAAMVGTYRAVRAKHVPRYLAEFEYRFNRRYRLETMIDRLAYVSLRTAPMPYRLLKLADVYA